MITAMHRTGMAARFGLRPGLSLAGSVPAVPPVQYAQAIQPWRPGPGFALPAQTDDHWPRKRVVVAGSAQFDCVVATPGPYELMLLASSTLPGQRVQLLHDDSLILDQELGHCREKDFVCLVAPIEVSETVNQFAVRCARGGDGTAPALTVWEAGVRALQAMEDLPDHEDFAGTADPDPRAGVQLARARAVQVALQARVDELLASRWRKLGRMLGLAKPVSFERFRG
jgi:hypothetical protein